MKSKFKIVVIVFLVLIVAGGVIGYFMWNKPHREVENEKSISITAAQLVKEYQQNETAANGKYLDKAIEVTGTVTEVNNNQDGNATVMLASEDDFTGVYCTLKESAANISNGANITIKGICKGMLTDVRIGEAIVVNK